MRRNFLRFGKRSGGGGVAPEGAKDDDYSMENSSNDGLDMVSHLFASLEIWRSIFSRKCDSTITNVYLSICQSI